MDKIVGIISKAPSTRSQNDDDFADRLSSRYTVILLIVFAILVGMNQYVRNPITCWAPVHFTGSHNKFMTSYCWVKNTYYLPWDLQIPRENEKRQMIPYYQWIPFILLAQAVLFYLPTIVWHGLNSKAGVDADSILAAAHTFSRTDRVENRERTLKMVVNQIDRFLHARIKRRHRSVDGRRCCRVEDCHKPCGRRIGNYLISLFLVSKIFYIGNVIGQLFLLNAVLATRYSTLGADIVKNLVENRDWTEDSYVAFPRVTLCDFKVRGQDMANVHPYTVQCVLPINLYNEKIYVFLWFWMVFIAAVSVLSFLVWFLRSVVPLDRRRFVRARLMEGNRMVPRSPSEQSKQYLKEFTEDYLQLDGVFLLRLIAHNTNGITTTEIACAVYDLWKEQQDARQSKDLEATQSSSITPTLSKEQQSAIDE